MAFHSFPEEFQGCLAITALRDKAFKDFLFVIDRSPKVVGLAFNFHKYLFQVPLPVRICGHLTDCFPAKLSGKHRAKSVLPKSNRLTADVDAAFVQKILHIAKRKRETNKHHNSQADDLGASFEVTKGGTFCDPKTLMARPARPNKISSESALPCEPVLTPGRQNR
jgi:hypothetical protein